jgi:hypothetical protein
MGRVGAPSARRGTGLPRTPRRTKNRPWLSGFGGCAFAAEKAMPPALVEVKLLGVPARFPELAFVHDSQSV